MKNKETNTIDIKLCEKNIKESSERVFTLKLAIKGLLGNIPEYVVDKLVEICGEISSEMNLINCFKRMIDSEEAK